MLVLLSKSSAQVQSDLSSLAATVNSIQGSIGSTVDAALADGLADINAAVAELESQIDNIATGDDVDNINSNLEDLEEDLQELLESNNVYSSPVNIYNVATLDFADALGEKLNIVNGAINIYAIPEMDSIKLQEVVNRIKVVVGNFNYFAKNSEIATVSFDSLSGVSDLIVSAPHNLSFANLASAGKVTLGNNYDNKVKSIDFGKLAVVTSLNMGAASFAGTSVTAPTSQANAINYDNSDALSLGSLTYYSPSDLTIVLDSGASLDISSLDDKDSTGSQKDLDLNITGADSVVLPNYDDGDFSATDVGTVDLAKWKGDSGTLSLSQITHVKLGAVETNVAIGSMATIDNDLETLEVTAAKGTDSSDKAPTVKVYSTSLETAKVGGVTGDVLFENCPSLETAEIRANSVGTITLSGNANLNNVTLSGQAAGVVVHNNADIESLSIDSETEVSDVKDAKLDGVITVTDNASLASLTVKSDNIETLTITGNSDLTAVDLTSLTKIGATGKPVVKIYNNDLTATKFTDKSDGDTNVANGATGDLGSISTSSGLDTAKTYLGVVAGDADATAEVYFDTVDVFTDEANVDSPNHKYVAGAASQLDQITVLSVTPTTGAAGATKAKRSWIIPSTAMTLQVNSGVPATNLFQSPVTINPNGAVSLININGETNYASAAGLTLNAQQGGNSTVSVTLSWHGSGVPATVIGERHSSVAASTGAVSATNHGFGTEEVITFKVGANTVTTTVVGGLSAATLANAVSAIKIAYDAKYGATGTASASAVASLATAGSVLGVNGLDPGSRGHGLAVSLSVAAGTTTATNGLALDWTIGTSLATTDNKTDSQNIILTLEAADAGILADTTTPTTFTLGAGTATTTLLTSTQLTVGTDPNKGTYTAQQESRADVTIAEDAVAGSGGSNFSRVGWL